MRFDSSAVSVVLGAVASISAADAFVLPTPASSSGKSPRRPTLRTEISSLLIALAAKNDGSEYVSIEESLFNGNRRDVNKNQNKNGIDSVNNGAENPSTQTKKPRKPNARTEKLRAQLEADLAIAEESRALIAQQLADAEVSRLALETDATKAAREAEALEVKFKAFEAKESARAAAGGAGLGAAEIVGEIAAPLVGGLAAFGGLAAARDQLATRSQKVEEERLQREEELRAEEAARKKATRDAQTKKLLPVVGAGVAGLGVFGAFFGSDSSGGGGDAVVDAMAKNTLRDTVPKQQTKVNQPNKAGSATTAVPDPSKVVDLPYLDKAIAKAENKPKEIPLKQLSKRQSVQQASDKQRAIEARLEQKLAEVPEMALKSAEAEAKAAEEARIEAETKALLEKEKLERKAAEEKAIAEKKAFEAKKAAEEATAAEKVQAEKKAAEEVKKAAEKKAAEEATAAEKAQAEKKAAEEAKKAAEKAEAERIIAEKKAAEKAKAEKIAADKLAFEKLKAEEQKRAAEAKAKADKIAADKLAFEKMKAEEQKRAAEEKAKAEKIAADKLAFENLKSEQDAIAEQKARGKEAASALKLLKQQDSLNFTPKVPAVSEMLFGNNKQSLVTDKGLSNIFSPNNVMIGGAALVGVAVAGAVVAANESPSVSSTFKVTGKTPKEYLESENNGANEAPAPKKTIRIPQQGKQNSQGSPDSSEISPLSGSKEDLRLELAKQRANINRQADEKSSRNARKTITEQRTSRSPKSADSKKDIEDEKASNTKPKKSYSPFGKGKPNVVTDNFLYSPPISLTDDNRDTSLIQSAEPSSDQSSAKTQPSNTTPKTSSSPFAGSKDKRAVNNSSYFPSVSDFATTDSSASKPLVKPPDTPLMENVKEDAKVSKRSYSPFGIKPKAVVNDSLYSPPASQRASEYIISSNNEDGKVQPASTLENTLYSNEKEKPETASSNQLNSSNLSAEIPKNYLPFSSAKPTAVIDKPLYRPPNSESSQESMSINVRNNESKTTSTAAMATDPEKSASRPQNFVPFDGKEPVTSYDDSLYTPSEIDQVGTNSKQEEILPFSASNLDDTSSSPAPEITSSRGPLKKSFSPFGLKPKVPDVTNGISDGYLDGL